MAYTFFDKKIGLRVSVNEEPAEELHEPVIKIFKRRKNQSRFEDNIWVADLAEMIPLSSKNQIVNVPQMFSLNMHGLNFQKKKNGKQLFNAFIEIVNESNRKINYGLIKKENFTINLYENGQRIKVFEGTPYIMNLSH